MTYRFDHFVRAQEHVIEQAIEEILSGKKTGHWIWYIFPQMIGLGKSGMSQTYAIKGSTRICVGIISKEFWNIGRLRMRCSIIPTKRNIGSQTRNIPKFLYSLDIYILSDPHEILQNPLYLFIIQSFYLSVTYFVLSLGHRSSPYIRQELSIPPPCSYKVLSWPGRCRYPRGLLQFAYYDCRS